MATTHVFMHALFLDIGAGAYAGCSYCCVKGYYCHDLNKMVYLDHRSFLPTIDTLRSDRKHFPSKTAVPLFPPQPKTMEFIDSHNGELAAAQSKAECQEIMRRSGCTGSYTLRKLPFHD